eukprot:767927-Hanusia_phi.AAC.1
MRALVHVLMRRLSATAAAAGAGLLSACLFWSSQTLDRIREVHGTYAEYCVADCQETAEVPEDVSFEQVRATKVQETRRMKGLAGSSCAMGRFDSLRGAGSSGRNLLQERDGREESRSDPWRKRRCGDVCGPDREALPAMPHNGDMQLVEHRDDGEDRSRRGRQLQRDELLGQDQQAHLGTGGNDFSVEAFEMLLVSSTQGRVGYNLVLDCVGGDDYWQACQPLLVEDGSCDAEGVWVV